MMKYNICTACNKEFPHRIKIDNIVKMVHKRKYCFECRPTNWKQIEIEQRKTKKVCSTCKIEKSTMENFHKDKSTPDGFTYCCKQCRETGKKQYNQDNKERLNAQSKQYYQDNKKELKEYHKQYRKNHKEETKNRQKRWCENNKEKMLKQKKQYYKDNRDKINEHTRNRFKNDIQFKLKQILRGRTRSAIKNNQKIGHAVRDLGCSIKELEQYLESQFQSEMSWDNYGFYGWHIDHIIPLSRFDLTNRKQFLEACHYKNLQPMWAEDNLKKSNKLPKERNENENMFDMSQTKS